MEKYPRITIVTPSYNDSQFLEATILSIVDQNYPNLEYIIMDGGSSDGSVEIIRKYEKRLTFWQSQSDKGMYDAIQKGFGRSTGEIMGWINSDDKHQPGSLFTIAQIFSDFKNIHWLQGTPTVIDKDGRIFTDPHRYHVDKFFFYNRGHARTHKFIQQESTFWRRSLWVKAGQYISTRYRYAGDFELWMRFFQLEKLYHVNAVLGSFRQTPSGQASTDHYQEYLNETFSILESLPLSRRELRQLFFQNIVDKLAAFCEKYSRIVKKKLKNPTIVTNALYFDPREQKLKKW